MAKYLCNSTIDPRRFEEEYEEAVAIYYDLAKNVFIDVDGQPIFDIFLLITPNDYYLFKHKKDYMIVQHRTMPEVFVEMYYPTRESWRDIDEYHDYNGL